MKIACVTGHRYITNNSINRKAVNELIRLAVESQIEKFLVGMSRGADFLFAQILSERKLNWVAVVPCVDQDKFWNDDDRSFYKSLLGKAEDIVILHSEYHNGVMHYRNEHMIDNSEMLLAIYDDSGKGGTFHTVNLALKKHKRVLQFNPQTHEFNVIKSRQLSLTLF